MPPAIARGAWLSLRFKLDDYFARLQADKRFVDLAADLLQDEVTQENMQWFNKPAKLGTETPPHQDGFYFMLEPNHAVTMWLALNDADEANGCMRYIPGSHKGGIRPHSRSSNVGFSQGLSQYTEEDYAAEQAIPAQPGDIIVHHCLTVHRAGDNQTERQRASLGFIYFAKSSVHDKERAAAYQAKLYAQWEAEKKI